MISWRERNNQTEGMGMHFDYIYPAQTEEQARDKWPDAVIYTEVCGGWAAWDSASDYETWTDQK